MIAEDSLQRVSSSPFYFFLGFLAAAFSATGFFTPHSVGRAPAYFFLEAAGFLAPLWLLGRSLLGDGPLGRRGLLGSRWLLGDRLLDRRPRGSHCL